MSRSVHVRAPCRLHFGMFSFGHVDRPQFGGVGVMVDPPHVEVTIKPAASFAARGALANRVEQFVALIAQHEDSSAVPPCEVSVRSPPDHVGLGVGTQLGLSVAAGLRRFLELPELRLEQLARSVGRGLRSAVGTYGFQYGGLIVDAGKEPGEALGQLARRIELPSKWRFVLVRGACEDGLAGDRETDAFARLPPMPPDVTTKLWQITDDELLPAVERADCEAFGEAVYQFGRLAGECFAAVQGGPFANSETTRLVESIRNHGVPGVGQSSWGPTVFAITADEREAESLAQWLRGMFPLLDRDITIASPSNQGAQLSTSR
jgi:beta-ribofuranosylaminobenzene 5'-phosphate synthase